jgi:chitodextrinase
MQMTFFSILPNPQLVSAAQVSFQWNENTESDLAGYMIHYGTSSRTSSGIYTFSEDVGDQTTYTLSGLEEGQTYYFALTAYNTQRMHSDFTIELSKYFPELDEDCGDGMDNDEDGLTDCDDPECAGDPACLPPPIEICGDGVDNDEDGLTDCDDPECAGDPACLPPPIEICGDGVDNDEDGLTDCDDPQCDSAPICGTGAGTVISEGFDSGPGGFIYLDDVFGSDNPSYASGNYDSAGGFSGGGLCVALGGIDNEDILDMSGGWKKAFTLSNPTEVILSFRYSLTQASDYESDEFSQVLMSLDGSLYGQETYDYVDEIVGNGNGGNPQTTGWRLFQVNSGILSQGDHTLIIGGYNNKKTYNNETTQVIIDDVLVVGAVADGGNSPPVSNDQTVTTEEDTAVTFTLAAVDPDGDFLTYRIAKDPANGFLTGVAPNLIYTPDSGYVGPDAFTFKANDGWADSNVATVNIAVTSVNEKPVANLICVCDGLSCTFDASGSYDADGTIQSYLWDFGDNAIDSGEIIIHTYQEAGTYSASLTVTDNGDSTDITSQNITVTEEPTNTMHIGDLDDTSAPSRWRWWARRWGWQPRVTITVNDANENPVTGATISGMWSGGIKRMGVCITDKMGQCTVTSQRIRNSKDEVMFTVDNIIHTELTYMSTDNWDPDEDSDGTAIKVNRP